MEGILVAKLSRPAIRRLLHGALSARVGLLLGQVNFAQLLAEQERVSLALARGATDWHAPDGQGSPELARAVLLAFELDPGYYSDSSLDFIIGEGLASVGLALAELVRGHEGDSRSRWQAEVVPALDQVAEFAVSVFDGRWGQAQTGLTLGSCLPSRLAK